MKRLNLAIPHVERERGRENIYDSASSLAGRPRETELNISKRYMHSHVYYSPVHSSQEMASAQMFITR